MWRAVATMLAVVGGLALMRPTSANAFQLVPQFAAELRVGGRAGVPLDAIAVVLNVTATDASGPGFLTIWPCGQARPLASNLNFDAGQVVPNVVVTRLGTDGLVCITPLVPVHVVVDVAGFFPATSDYHPIVDPTRILDTRRGTGAPIGTIGPGAALELGVGGVAEVPRDATAAILNVTVTEPAAAGYVTVWPCGEPRPLASNLNYVAGQTVANVVVAKLGTNGTVCIASQVATHVVVDVSGYHPAGSAYRSVSNPTRLLDTRNGGAERVRPGAPLHLAVRGQAAVPTDASAVVLNVTVTDPVAAGYLTVWPCSEPQPLASNLNYAAGQTVPNLVVAKVGVDGDVCFATLAPTHLVADLAGYHRGNTDYRPITNPTRLLDTRNLVQPDVLTVRTTGAPATLLSIDGHRVLTFAKSTFLDGSVFVDWRIVDFTSTIFTNSQPPGILPDDAPAGTTRIDVVPYEATENLDEVLLRSTGRVRSTGQLVSWWTRLVVSSQATAPLGSPCDLRAIPAWRSTTSLFLPGVGVCRLSTGTPLAFTDSWVVSRTGRFVASVTSDDVLRVTDVASGAVVTAVAIPPSVGSHGAGGCNAATAVCALAVSDTGVAMVGRNAGGPVAIVRLGATTMAPVPGLSGAPADIRPDGAAAVVIDYSAPKGPYARVTDGTTVTDIGTLPIGPCGSALFAANTIVPAPYPC